MFLVGVTGGIGAGKSTVARMLADRGAVVIDADVLAREVVAPGSDGFDAVVDRFGDAVVAPDGTLDRGRLARIVFSDPAAREDLDAIVHPRVRRRIAERLGELDGSDAIVVLDLPLLVEAARDLPYGAVVVVEAPEDVRVARLVRRGVSADDARARIAAQAGDAERRAIATHVVDNGGDRAALDEQVGALWEQFRTAAAGRSP